MIDVEHGVTVGVSGYLLSSQNIRIGALIGIGALVYKGRSKECAY